VPALTIDGDQMSKPCAVLADEQAKQYLTLDQRREDRNLFWRLEQSYEPHERISEFGRFRKNTTANGAARPSG
jgi:hypothetical protein